MKSGPNGKRCLLCDNLSINGNTWQIPMNGTKLTHSKYIKNCHFELDNASLMRHHCASRHASTNEGKHKPDC